MKRKRFRLAAVFCTVVLAAAGASLATGLSALAQETPVTTTDTVGESTSPSETEPIETTTAADPPASEEPAPPADPPPPAPAPPSPPAATPPPPSQSPGPPASQDHIAVSPPARAPSPEIESWWAYPTVWLHRPLADPTPPARRLAPGFARRLQVASARANVHWSLVLAVLRAHGHGGRIPASRHELERLAKRVAHASASEFSDEVHALARYNRAVGLHALVTGLQAAKPRLQRRLLADPRADIYPAGRTDIASGRIDVRVLVLIRYLAVSFGQVTVSSLHSGHPYYARPGVVSAHMYGLAVDISAVASAPIYGNQGLGSITERAVEAILLLPAELQPQQIISLLGLGGSSLALSDHHDHIHVGF
jgi:hypothetical protein